MITNTQVMWTCLPNGVVTTGAAPTFNLSVVVTPRLTSTAAGDTIAGSVFQNWPACVRAIGASGGWSVSFDGNSGNAQVPADVISATPSFDVDGALLWQAIFPAATPVAVPDTSGATPNFSIHSFDAGQIATAVRAAHAYAVQSHARYGKLVLTGNDPYSTLLAHRKRAKQLLPKMAAALRGHGHGAAHKVLREAYRAETGEIGVGYELMRHAMFYDHDKHRARLRAERGLTPALRPFDSGAPPPADNDFNSVIGHLGGQPLLLRKLGLIIDLQFQASQIPGLSLVNQTVPYKVSLNPPSPSNYAASVPGAAALHYVTPVTSADISATYFRATVLGAPGAAGVPSAGSINSGFLPLGDTTQYSIFTEDTEGAPIKLDIVNSSPTTAADGSDMATPVPAFRTAGLAVSQIGRDQALETAYARQQAFSANYWAAANPQNETLFAEDVVRGYAVDVQVTDSTGVTSPFRSLCLRDSRLYFPALSAVPGVPAGAPASFVLSDEGYSKASAANAPDDSDELDLHTTLFGWEGWSLAAQRPGRAITAAVPAGDTVQTETPLQPVNTPTPDFPNAQFTVRPRAGTVPRLRFGSTYTFRARVIDLAGNDMSVANGTGAVAPVTVNGETFDPVLAAPTPYLRYEPVPNPVIVMQAPVTEGEHVENLVIRSNPWGATPQDAAQYAAFANSTTSAVPLSPMNPYSATSARWVAPPKGSWSQAEAMGAFDGAYFNVIRAAVAADITSGAIKAGQSYASATFLATKSLLFQCSQKEAGLFTDAQVWDTSNPGATSPSAANPIQVITPPTAQNLPPPTDPGQPMAPGQYNILLNDGSPVYLPYLPDANAKGLGLQQLDGGGNVVAAATRTFAPRPGLRWPEIDMPQIVIQDGGVGAPLPSIAGATSNPSGLDASSPGSNTPIVFSLAPGQQVSLNYGSVVADVTKMAGSFVDSSGQLETIPTYAPFRPLTLVHAVQQPKPPASLNAAIVARQAGDTSITITGGFAVDGLTSSSVDFNASWIEFVDAELGTNIVEMTGTNYRYTIKQGRVQSWTLLETDTAVAFPAAGAAAPLLQQFGDTKTRAITFQATATSRFREYFPASLQDDAANFQNSVPAGTFSAKTLANGVVIPSTARPVAPKILYVVPTYAWSSPTTTTSGTTTTTTSVRNGRGIRVFVDRPWFTTGGGEQLAVLLSAASAAAPVPALANYVSQWGKDPALNPQADQLAPLSSSQIEGGTPYPNVPLAETSGVVDVQAFNPSAYDPVRKLWYFDIEFQPAAAGANTVEAPFVRLALARFQTNSLGISPFAYATDLRMSTVVLADMTKLAADRTGSYVYNSADGSVNVTLSGPVYSAEAWTPASGTLTVNTRNDGAAYGRMVCVQVLESTVANPGEFDWYAVGGAYELDAYQLAGKAGSSTALSFMGSIAKPDGLVAGAKHQLLITEHEVFLTDTEVAFPGDTPVQNFPGKLQMTPPPKPPARPPLRPNTTSRIIFSDVLTLPY